MIDINVTLKYTDHNTNPNGDKIMKIKLTDNSIHNVTDAREAKEQIEINLRDSMEQGDRIVWNFKGSEDFPTVAYIVKENYVPVAGVSCEILEIPVPQPPNKHASNRYNTTDLVLDVMATVARKLALDINNDIVADELYDNCCNLEDFPEDQGFGGSDHYSYIQQAKKDFHIVEERPYNLSEAMERSNQKDWTDHMAGAELNSHVDPEDADDIDW